MRPSRFKEEQTIAILGEQEAATADVCRRHGISSVTPQENGAVTYPKQL